MSRWACWTSASRRSHVAGYRLSRCVSGRPAERVRAVRFAGGDFGTRITGGLFALWLCLSVSPAMAHPLAPAALLLVERDDGDVEVKYRTNARSDARLELVIDPRCSVVREDAVKRDVKSVLRAGALRCSRGLKGTTFLVRGLQGAGVSAVVQLRRADGTAVHALLSHGDNVFSVPAEARGPDVFLEYLRLGAEHLWTGLDHLLFLLMLLLAVRDRVRALWMLTAFTAGHSLTLALSALDLVNVPGPLAEIGIAASLVWMAAVAAVPLGGEPSVAWLPAGFGLLHGLGFAGVLRDVGLAPAHLPLSLFAFNLGIELGQLLLAVGVWALALLAVHAQWWALRARSVLIYVAGVLAAFWVMERTLELL